MKCGRNIEFKKYSLSSNTLYYSFLVNIQLNTMHNFQDEHILLQGKRNNDTKLWKIELQKTKKTIPVQHITAT